jgi:hypothetical protein
MSFRFRTCGSVHSFDVSSLSSSLLSGEEEGVAGLGGFSRVNFGLCWVIEHRREGGRKGEMCMIT